MDPNLILILTIVGAATLLVGGALAANAFATARLLGATGPTPMAEVTAMLQEVRGTVVADERKSAPLSGRSCVYWRLMVEEQRRTRWESVIEERDGVPIALDDGTGRVRLDPRAAEPVVTAAGHVRTGIFAYPSPEWTELVARLGVTSRAPSTAFLRWREEVLDAGDTLTAIGDAQQDADGWAIVPAEGQMILSDRDDSQVVRQHRRRGQRCALVAIGGAMVAAWSAFSLLG